MGLKKVNKTTILRCPIGTSEKDKRKIRMRMILELYDSEIREIAHYNGYIIINQSYWYPESKYSEEEAKEKYMSRKMEE